MKYILYLSFFFLFIPLQSLAAPHNFYPIMAYTDTGYLFGGFYVFKPQDSNFSHEDYLVFADDGFETETAISNFKLGEGLFLATSLFYSTLPELYFGLGNETLLSNQAEIKMTTFSYRLGIRKDLSPHYSSGMILFYLNRDERSNYSFMADESYLGGDFFLSFDSRDHKNNSQIGKYFNLTGTYVNRSLRLLLDLRSFQPFLRGTLALRNLWGATLGDDPLYSQLFRLGSASLLRGIYSNRYVAKNLTSFQVEYRFPLFSILSGSTFLEAGRVGDSFSLSNLHLTKGAGISFLIPDTDTTLRFNLAFSHDTYQVYGIYGQAF